MGTRTLRVHQATDRASSRVWEPTMMIVKNPRIKEAPMRLMDRWSKFIA
jgi:hypothetical protein